MRFYTGWVTGCREWMIHELARHGYTLSPGTLYPMLHSLQNASETNLYSWYLGYQITGP